MERKSSKTEERRPNRADLGEITRWIWDNLQPECATSSLQRAWGGWSLRTRNHQARMEEMQGIRWPKYGAAESCIWGLSPGTVQLGEDSGEEKRILWRSKPPLHIQWKHHKPQGTKTMGGNLITDRKARLESLNDAEGKGKDGNTDLGEERWPKQAVLLHRKATNATEKTCRNKRKKN